ncbi:MAG: DNA repair protein RadC [Porphyromonas sp.]|nr:DNA repair protein RadC [Porphyromonas sp.]
MFNQENRDLHLTVKEMLEEERPREKLLRFGVKNLDTTELLALILNTGTKEQNVIELARSILKSHDNNLYSLYRVHAERISDNRIKGIGPAKLAKILAALELGIRLENDKELYKTKEETLNDSQKVYHYMKRHLFGLGTESVWLLCFNASQKLIVPPMEISTGGITESTADLRVILKKALCFGAVSIILVHNHPSGSLTPSSSDNYLTKSLDKACKTIGITLQDHIIYSDYGYYSYAEKGEL